MSDFLARTLPDTLPQQPVAWLQAWLDEAKRQNLARNPNSMTLVTVAASGLPSARVVLCKELQVQQGYVVFYTNYRSRKSQDIEANPQVAGVFHWDAMGRQVRIEGRALRSPAEESDAYFSTRDRGSQLGAWASDQSRPIASRQALLRQLDERRRELGADGSAPIPRPPHWGGFRIWLSAIELWVEGADRVHDRARFERDLGYREDSGSATFSPSSWTGSRLQP
ncbi:MAG: pyridoxamine 5'-phosphate oxidase [Woeseiaceae bacterium]|nr:pyridoxamine 5'-phosphate oxidase [Woeseiaceae bacterium]